MTLAIALKFLAVVGLGYLIGSIPFGVLVGRKFAKVDVRKFGSGKMGTTNVLRVAGKKAAAVVFIMDLLKGALSVLAAWLVLRGEYRADVGSAVYVVLRSAPALAALAAIAGHIWPVFMRFKGGRGVATFYGGMFALNPLVAFFSGQVFILGTSTTRYVSVGSIAGAVAAYAILVPLVFVSGFPWENLLYGTVGSIAIIATHRDNIQRLMAGKERKLGEPAETMKPAARSVPWTPGMAGGARQLASLRWSKQNLHG